MVSLKDFRRDIFTRCDLIHGDVLDPTQCNDLMPIHSSFFAEGQDGRILEGWQYHCGGLKDRWWIEARKDSRDVFLKPPVVFFIIVLAR